MAFDPDDYGLGWNQRSESIHEQDGSLDHLRVCAAPFTETIPDNLEWDLVCKNQGPIGSCEGHAMTTVAELDNLLGTKEYVRLSPRFGYLVSKLADNSLGHGDTGASISGGALAASKYGYCLEATFPYWDYKAGEMFDEAMNQDALAEGTQHLMRATCDIPDWDFGQQFVGSLQGGFSFGINWYESLARCDGKQEVVTNVSGASRGGHALCVCDYKMVKGKRIPRVRNSHSKAWGNKGSMLIDGDLLFELIRQSGFGAKGFTGLNGFETRSLDSFKGMVG